MMKLWHVSFNFIILLNSENEWRQRQDASLENISRQATKRKLTRCFRSVHLAVVVSFECEDFLCQARVTTAMLLIVNGWNKDMEP